jgi:hypothetical protein
MSWQDEDYPDLDVPHVDHDPCAHLFCQNCGLDWPGCGCPNDTNTMTLMACAAGHHWWNAWGLTDTRCIHTGCGQESTVERPAMYPPVPVAQP